MTGAGSRALCAAVVAAAASAAGGHGASKGLHLHLTPVEAALGSVVELSADCAEPMTSLRVSFVGGKPVLFRPEMPSRRAAVKLTVPESAGSAVNAQGEAVGASGKTYRASALLRIR